MTCASGCGDRATLLVSDETSVLVLPLCPTCCMRAVQLEVVMVRRLPERRRRAG